MKICKKFGISVALLSMLCYFTGYFNLFACAILFVAIMALCEEEDLKINATQAIVFAAVIDCVQAVLERISDVFFNVLYWIAGLFSGADEFYFTFTDIISWMQRFDIISFAATLVGLFSFVCTIIFVVKSLKGGVVKVPFVTNLVAKHFEKKVA